MIDTPMDPRQPSRLEKNRNTPCDSPAPHRSGVENRKLF
jgi:hypothetical protein